MAKLLIFRGEAQQQSVELPERTVRVGRDQQSEIRLDDKGVSRQHAEIRFDAGRHLLVDCDSVNGLWVDGSRVSSVSLEPGVVASVGPFRLTIEAPTMSARVEDAAALPTMMGPMSALAADASTEHETHELTASPTARVPAAPPARHRVRRMRTWLIAGTAVVFAGAVALAGYMLAERGRPAFDIDRARALVAAGECEQALNEIIEPALLSNPDDAAAIELTRTCAERSSSAAVPPPPAPPVSTAAPELDEAEAMIAANDCAGALDRINAVLADDSGNERATELLDRANACIAAAAKPSVPAEALAVRVAPAQGGLDVKPKELDRDYQNRRREMRRRYDEAVAMLERKEFLEAAEAFDGIAGQVPEGYLDLDERRAEAKEGVKREAANYLDAAQQAERAGDLDRAIDAYRSAHRLDPSLQVDAPVQRIGEQKLQRGKKKCEEAKLAFSYGENPAAAAAFQEVLKLLPASEPCHALAQERLRQLGK